jgi:hypothetical protein
MAANVGDHIIVESEKVGRPAREGEILEVIPSSAHERYRVRWNDGHESTITPGMGSERIVPASEVERTRP